VSYGSPGGVGMIAMDGQVIKEIDDLKTGQQLFEYPNYIAISNSGDIFVSDSGTAQ